MIGCDCAVCTSDDPRDKRLRTGLLVENGNEKVLIDISADFREQALRAKLSKLDAVLITHCHADHVFGLDDLRPINFKYGDIPVYASESTWKQLRRVFYYIFEREHVGGGLPQITPQIISDKFQVCGLNVTPFNVIHGKTEVTGFRFNNGNYSFAFVTDCNQIPDESLDKLRDLDLLIIDAVKYTPHPTHLHVDKALEYIDILKPEKALLTHIGHDIKASDAESSLPDNVRLAYDGLRIAFGATKLKT